MAVIQLGAYYGGSYDDEKGIATFVYYQAVPPDDTNPVMFQPAEMIELSFKVDHKVKPIKEDKPPKDEPEPNQDLPEPEEEGGKPPKKDK